MAKKKTTRKKFDPKKFLAELATNPEKLGKFILDPEGVMNAEKVPKEHRMHIKNALAHEIHRRLTSDPEAYAAVFV